MPNYLKINTDALPKYSVEDLIRLALEQNLYFADTPKDEPEIINYTLKQLTNMPFEQWARLIELENMNINVPRNTVSL